MKGYKGFEKGMVCRGKQYAENATFEESGDVELCKSGMHFCKNPFDVLRYYPFVNENGAVNEFAEVEALGKCKTDNNKSVTNKLHIGAKLSIAGLVKAFVDFTLSKIDFENIKATNTGNYSAATNTGDNSAAEVSGCESFAICTGVEGKAKGSLDCYIALAEYGESEVLKRTKWMDKP